MTRPVLFSVVVALALLAAACGSAPTPGGGTPTPVGPTPTGAATATGTATATGAVTATAPPTIGGRLAAVKQRGQLVCGVNGGLAGFSFLEEGTNTWSGFDVDFCRALAAAVLADPNKVEFRRLSTDERGPALQTGEIDVLIRNTTWTVTRDATWGLFGPTTFYDGQGMMVTKASGVTRLEDMGGATICVQSGTTTELNLTDQMRKLNVQFTPRVFAEIDPTYETYFSGACDAVTSDRSQLSSRRSQATTPADHVILDAVMSKEPLGPVAPLNDDSWFNVVKWVVFATFQAEELDISMANVEQTRATSTDPVVRRLLGVQPEVGDRAALLGLSDDWVVNVIKAVGNYAEIYDRNLGPNTPLKLDRGLNRQWVDGGLLYSPPYR